MPPMSTLPEVRRVSYAEHAETVAREIVAPDEAGRVASEACRLEPLQRIQVAFDQLTGHAEGRRRGEAGPYGHDYAGYVKAELAGARRHHEVLRCAADAADAMIDKMERQILELETAMARQKNDDDAPKLTNTGEPHPLQKGGYDPNADPQLPGNISDIEALKEGKTTRAENEAIAASDADEDREPLDPPTEAPLPDDDDDDRRKRSHKGKGHK